MVFLGLFGALGSDLEKGSGFVKPKAKATTTTPHHTHLPKPNPTPPHPNPHSKSVLIQPKQVGSWWNLHRSFLWMLPPIWHHLQVHQECPCPPKLQEEILRIGGFIRWSQISILDKTFTEASDRCSIPYNTTSRSIRNVHVLLNSKKRFGRQVESWHASRCQILMKLSQMLLI